MPPFFFEEEPLAETEVEIQPKSVNALRNKFLSKLAYSHVWQAPQHRAKPHQTLIVFDWDDTLFCTSHFRP